ncbi:uncharacterized protein LOC8282692 isoform X2 [Ricinus communis]|uniref:uncharacterized protein LOC8282692 isoform X2 n=1 Tax=Ricinus communis TaxID=3988 RepID=UPI000D69885A|nr:uncharacterized protein LOC8282692 isoform X2 [Ricinus communis]|eukprot:XP_025012820.1 uncharacterized protein LOC8282692 isoform X2 [Ricinus communis]
MAWTLLSPFAPSLSIYTSKLKNRHTWLTKRSAITIVANASNNEGSKNKDEDAPSFNPFGFVTDNPSSRSAIQLPESPAEDGNVGQMLYRIEDKGKEYGSYVKSGKLTWFVRETGSPKSRRGTIVFLHGAPTQSYSYRVVMSQSRNLITPLHREGVPRGTRSITRGAGCSISFLSRCSGSYGLTWALKNQSKISKIAIFNSPLTVSSPVPGLFQKLRIPLYGEFTSQNAIEAERFIEAGSPYVLKLEKADVYRLPYLASSGPGFALLEAARKIKIKDILSQITDGFASEKWDKPILLAWGISDKYLPQSIAEEFQKGNPDTVKLKLIEGAGHMPQEDWPEKVVDALRVFF